MWACGNDSDNVIMFILSCGKDLTEKKNTWCPRTALTKLSSGCFTLEIGEIVFQFVTLQQQALRKTSMNERLAL